MFSFDQFIFEIFSNPDNIFVTDFFKTVSFIFDPIPFTIIFILTSFFVWRKFGKNEVFIFLTKILVSLILVWVLKYLFNIERPEQNISFSPSFPSAHSTLSMTYFLSVLHLLKRDKNHFRKILHYFFCILFVVSVGISRLFLGVHWLSDILAGYLLGGFVVYLVLKFQNKIINLWQKFF